VLQSTLLRAFTSTHKRRYLSELLGRAQMSLRLNCFSPAARSKLLDPSGFAAVRFVHSMPLRCYRARLAMLQSTRLRVYFSGAAEHIAWLL
jgi:hypothetical protein